MSEKITKAEINIGPLSFKGEGDQEWLSEQITKLLEAAAKSGIAEHPQTLVNPGGGDSQYREEFDKTLATYLKEKTLNRTRKNAFSPQRVGYNYAGRKNLLQVPW